MPGVITPSELDDVRAVYHLYIMRVPNGRREALAEFLKANGVSTGIHYPIALPRLNAYAYLGQTDADFPEATTAAGEILVADVPGTDRGADRLHRGQDQGIHAAVTWLQVVAD